jgi:ribonuclease R
MPIEPESVLRALDRRNRPLLTPQTLLRDLGGSGRERRTLAAVLRRLVDEGRVERIRGRYRIARDDGLIEGVFEGGRGGDGLVFDDSGGAWSVAAASAVASGERVLVEPLPGAPERAEVVRAIGGPRREWIGILASEGRGGVLRPYRDEGFWEFALPRAGWRGARPGDVVVAQVSGASRRAAAERSGASARRPRARGRRPARVAPAVARVVEVLGPPGTPEADFRAISWRHRLPLEFPPAALAEAAAFDAQLDPAEVARRLDLRALPFVTIDPVNARDHDDAVYVEPGSTGHRLWVAIADVSRYVPEGSALDGEARRRGNSVYFPDRAIPMLPERLSGELCSLRPEVDRLALAVELEIARDGAVRRARFHEAVIRSRARLVYEAAAEAMEGGAAARRLGADVLASLARLAALARVLMARRFAAGAIDFDLPTAEIVLGDAGHPTDIIEAPRTIAHRAIEEAMLAANRAVAEHLVAGGVPALFRVHEPPLPTQLEALRELLDSFDLLDASGRDSLGPLEIARAIQRAAGRPEERLVNLVALRSLRQARYGAQNRGHFALAFDAYLHFTSPIRRYADLVVHRALRDALANSGAARARAQGRAARLPGWAARVSWCERVAMEAEREAVDLKKCVFLRERVGERFDGTVTRVAKHGVYVTLDPFFVEGLVHVRRLPGLWELDERSFSLAARGGRERLRLGDRVQIRVASVDVVRGWIDFELGRRLGRSH